MGPSKPVGLRVEPRPEGYLKLKWTDNPPTDNVSHYSIYKGTRRFFVPDDTSLLDKTVGNSFLDTDVTGSTYYFYRVIAVDTAGNESEPSDPEQGKTPVDKILEHVTTFCLIAIVILMAFYFVVDDGIYTIPSYVLNLDGTPTFTNDQLTAMINNNNDPRTLTIHELDESSVSDVEATDLADNSGIELIPFSATVATAPTTGFPGVSKIELSIDGNDVKRGIFEAAVVVKANQISSIPIRLATEPLIVQAIIISGTGILVSIIFWEFIKYFKKNNDEQARRSLVNNARDARKKANLNLSRYQSLRIDLLEMDEKLYNLHTEILGTKNLMRARKQGEYNLLAEKRDHFEKLAQKTKIMGSLNTMFAEVNSEAAVRKSQQIENYKSRSLRPHSLWAKIIITEFGSAIFGISLGIFGLLSNDFVLGLRTVGPFEIFVLFGLGLGIGSLKEFVDK